MEFLIPFAIGAISAATTAAFLGYRLAKLRVKLKLTEEMSDRYERMFEDERKKRYDETRECLGREKRLNALIAELRNYAAGNPTK